MGMGRTGKSLSSDSPRFLRRIKKAGPGVETPEGYCTAGVRCIGRLMSGPRVWRRDLHLVPLTLYTAFKIGHQERTGDC